MTPWQWAKRLFRGERKDIGGRFFPGVSTSFPGQPVNQSWDVERAIREGYKQNNVVRDCINIRASTVARFPWYVEGLGKDAKGQPTWQKIEDHPLERLLKRPHIGVTGANLFARTVQHLDLAGNALWEKVGDGASMELWPLQPHWIRPVRAATGFIGEYQYQMGGGQGEPRVIPAERVVHFQFPDPGNEYWGQATIQSAAVMIDSYNAAVNWNRQALSNNVLGSMIFRSEQPLGQEDYENLQAEINRNYSVGSGGARRPIVVGSGMQAEMLNWKAQELDFGLALAFYRDQICHGFRVPLPVLGELAQATHSNVQEVIVYFLTDTAKPIAELLRDTLEAQLLPDFGDPATERLCFDTSIFEVLAADMTAKAAQLASLVTSGVPLNAVLEELDFDIDPVEGGDRGFIPATLQPIDMAGDLAEEQLANTQAQTQATLKPPVKPAAPKAA